MADWPDACGIGRDARRRAAIAGVLGVRHRELALRSRRLGHRPVQRVDAGRAWLRARRLSPALAVTAITGLAGNFVAGAWAERGSLRRVLVAALRAHDRGAPGPAARQHHRARDGAGGRDGNRGRVRDGGLLQLLGQGVRADASRADPGHGAGDDRLRLRDRPAAAGVVRGRDGLVRRGVLRPGRDTDADCVLSAAWSACLPASSRCARSRR